MDNNNNKQDLIEIMEFSKVDKISDDLYSLGSGMIARFNVSLSVHPMNSQQKRSFHKEYEYTNKFQEKSITIRRSFDYYISLESTSKDSNVFVRIGLSEFLLFRRALETVETWFTSSKYDNLFVKDSKGRLKLAEPIPEAIVKDLPMDKVIRIVPTIIERGIATTDQKCGVRIYVSEDDYSDMDINRFMGFVYLMSSFNMYQHALSVINYLGRPAFGFNRFDLDGYNATDNNRNISYNKKEEKTIGIKGRIVKSVHSNGIEDLEG